MHRTTHLINALADRFICLMVNVIIAMLAIDAYSIKVLFEIRNAILFENNQFVGLNIFGL